MGQAVSGPIMFFILVTYMEATALAWFQVLRKSDWGWGVGEENTKPNPQVSALIGRASDSKRQFSACGAKGRLDAGSDSRG